MDDHTLHSECLSDCLSYRRAVADSQSVDAELLACMSLFICVYRQYVYVTDYLYSVWRLFSRVYICLHVPICCRSANCRDHT